MKKVWRKKSQSLSLVKRDLEEIYNSSVYYNGQAYQFSNVIQYFIEKKYENPVDEANKNLFLNCLVNARKFSPGTELVLCELLVHGKSALSNINRVGSSHALEHALSWISTHRAVVLTEQIVQIMGSTGRIHTVEEPTQTDELILNTKCSIDLIVDRKFSQLVNVNNLKFDYVNVCVIEGAPASVAEINNLLLWSMNESAPLIIVARSFPAEVINTLAVNWKNKKLNIIPLVYGNTISNLNAHADIASISGAYVISALKGDTLYRNLESHIGSLQNFCIRSQSITTTPTVSPKVIVKNIKEKINKLDWADKDRRDIYLARLAGLSDKTLTVRLKKSIETWKVKNELEITISMYNNACTSMANIAFANGDQKIYPLNIYKKAKELQNVYDRTIESIGGYLIEP